MFSSVFLLFLDFLGHLVYVLKDTEYRFLYKSCIIALLIGAGPVLLTISVFGSLTDSINYNKIICKKGCVIINTGTFNNFKRCSFSISLYY